MYNKVIIVSFLALLSFGSIAQTKSQSTLSAENSFYDQRLNATNKIEIYPNPAVEFLIVEIDNSTLSNAKFEMHSIIGTEIEIKPEDMGNGKYRVQVKDFATGYYFLVVKDEVTRFKKAYRFLKK